MTKGGSIFFTAATAEIAEKDGYFSRPGARNTLQYIVASRWLPPIAGEAVFCPFSLAFRIVLV
jgi:hypothetical protein